MAVHGQIDSYSNRKVGYGLVRLPGSYGKQRCVPLGALCVHGQTIKNLGKEENESQEGAYENGTGIY